MTTPLTDLIAALESASEGSEELDERVALACGYTRIQLQDGDWWWQSPGGQMRSLPLPPRVTRSVDAALTLVPEGALWKVGHHGDHMPGVFVSSVMRLVGPTIDVFASTPALAICAAALRARGQETKE